MTRIERLIATQPTTILGAIETCAEIVTERSLLEPGDTTLEFAAELLTDFLAFGMAQNESWEFMQGRDYGDESDAAD